MPTNKEKVIIIGSGAAGLTAAIYTARANMSPLLIAGLQPGGQMTITTDVENYPGFADVIQGPWLMEQMEAQAKQVGTRIVQDIITSIDIANRPFVIKGDSGDAYSADSLIVATGAQARWLGLESESIFNGRGVSACATCDGFFFRNQEVVVVGGGNTAVEEALYLANIASKVTLIHRRNTLRAEKILQDRVFKNEKIDIITKKSSEISTQGCFVAIGHTPATEPFKNKIEMDEDGYIVVKQGTTKTDVAGIFAAGDCVDKVYRQAVTAAGLGCMSALESEKYIASLGD